MISHSARETDNRKSSGGAGWRWQGSEGGGQNLKKGGVGNMGGGGRGVLTPFSTILLSTFEQVNFFTDTDWPSWHLFVQSQQWKHQNNVWNLLKVNNKETKMMPLISQCSGVSTANFEQENASWVHSTIQDWIQIE